MSDFELTYSAMMAAIAAGERDEALRLVSQMTEWAPEQPSLFHTRGTLEFNMGLYDAALVSLARLAELPAPGAMRDGGRLMQGLIHGIRGDFDQAIRYLHDLNGEGAWYALGKCYCSISAFAAAVAPLEKVAASHQVACELGQAYMANGQYERAELALREAVKPGRVERHWATLYLGQLYMKQQRWDALDTAMRALLDDPHTLLAAHAVLANAALLRGELDAAAAWLPGHATQTNWSHTFVVQSITACQILMRDHGLGTITRRPHPYPDSAIGMSSSTFAYYGRFAHQLCDYLTLRGHADRHGLALETPDWIGHYLFELDDPLPSGPRVPVRRRHEWLDAEVAEKGARALAGFDFYSPGVSEVFTRERVLQARSLYKVRSIWKRLLEPIMQALRGRGNTVVSIHLRLTDRSHGGPSIEWYLDWLRALWPTLDRPVLYLASDDIAQVAPRFAEFEMVAPDAFPVKLSGIEWFQDFYILMHSDVVATSVGGFALIACMLNTTGRQFMMPDFTRECLREYSPLPA
ncbi:MAG: hypothetical protein V4508_19255 [Pseudomonadota bacterium]